MKKIFSIIIVLFIAVSVLSGPIGIQRMRSLGYFNTPIQGQDRRGAYVPPDLGGIVYKPLQQGENLSQQIKNDRISKVEKIVSNLIDQGISPYRKYSDGTYSYLGKALYQIVGSIPNTLDKDELVLLAFGYKIVDVTDDGCRIVPLGSDQEPIYEKDEFIVGLGGYSDRIYIEPILVKKIGSYTYSTITKSSRTIPKCERGQPASKEEYIKSFQK